MSENRYFHSSLPHNGHFRKGRFAASLSTHCGVARGFSLAASPAAALVETPPGAEVGASVLAGCAALLHTDHTSRHNNNNRPVRKMASNFAFMMWQNYPDARVTNKPISAYIAYIPSP